MWADGVESHTTSNNEMALDNPRKSGPQGLDNPWKNCAHELDTSRWKILALELNNSNWKIWWSELDIS